VYDAELFDEQLHELIGKLGLQKPVTLVACSLGGPIAATYTARHPEEVRSLVLIAPGYAGSQPMPPAIRAPLYGEYTMATAIAPRLGAGQAADLLHPEQHPEYVSRFEQQMRYPGFRRAILSTLRNFLVRDNRPDFRRVGELGKPVLLIWGRHDRDVPFAVSGEVRTAIPQAEFLPVEDAAHVPHIEHPEIVNPAIAAFLRKTTR
jgi:pimeloyl-ACP methyl ester carboxylesterase